MGGEIILQNCGWYAKVEQRPDGSVDSYSWWIQFLGERGADHGPFGSHDEVLKHLREIHDRVSTALEHILEEFRMNMEIVVPDEVVEVLAVMIEMEDFYMPDRVMITGYVHDVAPDAWAWLEKNKRYYPEALANAYYLVASRALENEPGPVGEPPRVESDPNFEGYPGSNQ